MKSIIVRTIPMLMLLLAACDSSTRPGGRGTLTAQLTSPNGADGAAVLDVVGAVESLAAPSDVSIYTTPIANGTRVVLVRMTPGELSMNVTVADISKPPAISVVQVADGGDRLREPLTQYAVTLR